MYWWMLELIINLQLFIFSLVQHFILVEVLLPSVLLSLISRVFNRYSLGSMINLDPLLKIILFAAFTQHKAPKHKLTISGRSLDLVHFCIWAQLPPTFIIFIFTWHAQFYLSLTQLEAQETFHGVTMYVHQYLLDPTVNLVPLPKVILDEAPTFTQHEAAQHKLSSDRLNRTSS